MRVLCFAFVVALVYTARLSSVSAAPATADDDYDPDFGDEDKDPDMQNDDDDYNQEPEEAEEPLSEETRIVSVSQDFFVKVGDVNVELPCKVSEPNANVVMWYKNSQLIFQDKIRLGNSGNNIQRLDDRSLLINVTDNDFGEYRCEILLGKYGNPFILHRVINAAPHNVTITAENGITELESGGRLLLKCSAEGTPKPTITWHRGTTALSVTGETLVIENLKHSDAGTYRCLADNHVGRPDHAYIVISILHKPRIDIQKILGNQNDRLNVELNCIVHAVPAATVTWQRNGTNVVTSRNIAFDNKGHTHALKIFNVRPEDFGEYTCSAGNHLGTSTKTVSVVGTPIVMQFKQPSKNSKEVELSWEVESVEKIVEHVIEFRKVGTEQWKTLYPEIIEPQNYVYIMKYTVPELEPGKYEARARSKNSYGWSKWSELVPFVGVSKKHGHHNKHHPKKEHKKTSEVTTQEPAPIEPQNTDETVKTGGVQLKASSGSTALPTLGLVCIMLLLHRN